MTQDEAYERLIACGTSREGALRVLTYAYWAQLSGGWSQLFISVGSDSGGSEGAKAQAMDIFREAGIDPMTIVFPPRS